MTAAQRTTADRMIAAKGMTVTLTRRAAGTYNPATSAAAITTSTQTGKGVILPSTGSAKMPGETVVNADSMCLLSALSSAGATLTAPEVGDTLTANGRDYAVTTVAPLSPAGVDIIYTLGVRAA